MIVLKIIGFFFLGCTAAVTAIVIVSVNRQKKDDKEKQ